MKTWGTRVSPRETVTAKADLTARKKHSVILLTIIQMFFEIFPDC